MKYLTIGLCLLIGLGLSQSRPNKRNEMVLVLGENSQLASLIPPYGDAKLNKIFTQKNLMILEVKSLYN
jgi:hypothetical protein